MNTNALHWYAVFKILSNPLLFISRFAMSQKFYPVSGRNWFTLDTVQLQSNGSTANFLGRRGIYAPAEYSFHCQTVNSFRDALLVPNSTAGNTTEWRLNFIDFQVQVLHLLPVTQYPCSNASSPFIMENVFFFFLVIRCLLSLLCSSGVFCIWFYATDSGLRFVQRNKFLLRQWLRRFLHSRDLDGTADLTAHALHFCVRSAHDHAVEHDGSIWWP